MPGAADEQATVLTHEADSSMDQSRIIAVGGIAIQLADQNIFADDHRRPRR
jgi:hypothetical protein